MKKIKAFAILILSIMFLSSVGFAQNETNKNNDKKAKEEAKNYQTKDNEEILEKDDDQFRPTAMTLAQDLQSKLTLSNDQVEQITDILVDYKEDIADIKRDRNDEIRASNGHTDVTGTTRTDRTDVAVDSNNVIGTNDNDEMLGGRTDFMEKFKDADVNANEDIEGVLEEGQLAKYVQIKHDWWQNVKNQVHSAASNYNKMEDRDDDDGLLDNNNKNNH